MSQSMKVSKSIPYILSTDKTLFNFGFLRSQRLVFLMTYKFNITLKKHINIKTQTGSAVNVYLIKLARGKR